MSEITQQAIAAQYKADAQALHTHLLEHDDELGPAILELVMLRAGHAILIAALEHIAGSADSGRHEEDFESIAACARDAIKKATGLE